MTTFNFAVTAFNPITGRRIVISRHASRAAAEKAARRATLWPEVKIEPIAKEA